MKKLEDISKDEYKELCNESETYADVFRKLNISPNGPQQRKLKKILFNHEIEFFSKPGNNSSSIEERRNVSLENLKCRKSIKNRLLKERIFEEKCSICGISNEWNGKKLSLQLDHINGICDDHRIENLRLLCPNCHSQTETFGAKRFKKSKSKTCQDCSVFISGKSKRCYKCAAKVRPQPKRKLFITKKDLEKLIWEYPTTKIACMFNVSDKTIEKFCKKLNISKPPRGFWNKNKSS